MVEELQTHQLISIAKQGDREALGRLLSTYRSYLAILAKVQVDARMRGKVSESDVVQDTMLRAKLGFVDFRGTTEGELLGWLRRILTTQLIDLQRHYHADRRDVKIEQRLEQSVENSSLAIDRILAVDAPSPSEAIQERERAALLSDALMDLPTDYREVLILHHFENLTFPQVAERLQRTVPSVKNLWVRAIAKLRSRLGDQG